MTKPDEPQTGAVAHGPQRPTRQPAQHGAAEQRPARHRPSLPGVPAARSGKPGRRDAFYFEQKTRCQMRPMARTAAARDTDAPASSTPHGDIHTPATVPVATQAAMKAAMLPETMKDLGAQCLLSNAFHLARRPGEQVLDEAGGLAKFMNWNGPTFTDSADSGCCPLGATQEDAHHGRHRHEIGRRDRGRQGAARVRGRGRCDVQVAAQRLAAPVLRRNLRWASSTRSAPTSCSLSTS